MLPDQRREFLASRLVPLELPAHSLLFARGDHGDRFFILVDGELEIALDDGRQDRAGSGVRRRDRPAAGRPPHGLRPCGRRLPRSTRSIAETFLDAVLGHARSRSVRRGRRSRSHRHRVGCLVVRTTIWGCRGSLCDAGACDRALRGHTSCVHVRTASGRGCGVLDAGTGARALGRGARRAGRRPDRALSHAPPPRPCRGARVLRPAVRAGHDGGDPRTAPRARNRSSVGSRPTSRRRFSPSLERIPARIEFVEVWHERYDVDGLAITAAPVSHPGRTVGYRLEERGRSLAFVPDNEPGLDPDAALELATGADVLFHDAQYTEEEYADEGRVGARLAAGLRAPRAHGEPAPSRHVPPRPGPHRRAARADGA